MLNSDQLAYVLLTHPFVAQLCYINEGTSVVICDYNLKNVMGNG